MKCTRIDLPDGASAILCGPRKPVRFCVSCLAGGVTRLGPLLCDWPLETGSSVESPRTCSKAMCDEHRRIGARPGIDYCRDHKGVPG